MDETKVQIEELPEENRPSSDATSTSKESGDVEHLAIADRFNIDTPTKEEGEKLQTIWSWVKQKDVERPIHDIVWDVINLEMTIGSPKLGETRLDKLYKYVKLRMNEARIQEQLKDTVL